MRQIKDKKLPVYAEADPEIAGSDVLLKHLGFEHLDGDIYQWPVYKNS